MFMHFCVWIVFLLIFSIDSVYNSMADFPHALASGLCLDGAQNYFHIMAESKKTTRGSNFVKNFGRAKPTLEGLLDWTMSHANLDGHMGATLMRFFNDQSGVDRKLKFWYCDHKQFPKYNERMWWETKDALARYRDNAFDQPMHYPGDGEPTGGADAYFQKDPLTADSKVIPFRLIHTRKIDNEMAADAALAFIDQEDYLGEHFRWENDEGDGDPFSYKQWDGPLLGVDAKKTNPRTPEAAIDAAREKWFIPTNDKDEQYDPKKHGMITVVSESAVRTINWYLDKIGFKREFKVHRLEDIREQFRGPGWQIKPSLKSYRLEWPTIRNLEEAQAITGNTLTGLLEGLVEKHLGAEVASYLFKQYEEGVAALDPHEDGNDPIDIWEYFEEKWNSYVAAIKPLGNKVPSTIEPTTPESLMSAAKERFKQISNSQKEMAMQMGAIAEMKRGNPELFPSGEEPKGGHSVSKSGESTTLHRTYSEGASALMDLGMITMAMTSPIPFSSAKPEIMTKITGSLKDGLAVTDDFKAVTFVGYTKTVEDDNLTYEELAKIATEYCKKHFPEGQNPDFRSITPEMLKWASDDVPIAKNTKIICPDPRTFGSNLRKSLEAK